MQSKYDYSEQIASYKNSGQIEQAIACAAEAREMYPRENIFEKFLGDLYVQKGDYESAGKCYIEFLKKLGDNRRYFKHFSNFLQVYAKNGKDIENFH